MKKSQKMRGLIAMIAVALFIDFIVLFGSNLSWGPKLVITGISVSGQIIAIWSWLHTKPRPHKIQKDKGKTIFDLSAKLYTILVLSASIFYTVVFGLRPQAKVLVLENGFWGLASLLK